MLQAVRMPFVRWQACSLGVGLEDPEELSAIEAAAFLAGEEIVRTIALAIAKPSAKGNKLVKQRLAFVPIQRLNGAERSLQAVDGNRLAFQVDIGSSDVADLGSA